MKGTLQQLKLALKPLGDCKESYNQLKYDCPVCLKNGNGLGKHNLEVKFLEQGKGIFNCWACNYKGPISKLIKEQGNAGYKDLFRSLTDSLLDKHLPKEKEKLLELPGKITSVFRDKQAIDYLHERGVSNDKIKERNIKISLLPEYKNCIIFPNYSPQTKLLNGFVIHNYITKKYTVRKTKECIFYEEFIDKNIPVVITEGVYDGLCAFNAIPLLGVKVSVETLEFLSNTRVILALDNDVQYMVLKTAIKDMESFGCLIEYLKIKEEYKDLNEYFCKDSDDCKTNLKECYTKLILQEELQ